MITPKIQIQNVAVSEALQKTAKLHGVSVSVFIEALCLCYLRGWEFENALQEAKTRPAKNISLHQNFDTRERLERYFARG